CLLKAKLVAAALTEVFRQAGLTKRILVLAPHAFEGCAGEKHDPIRLSRDHGVIGPGKAPGKPEPQVVEHADEWCQPDPLAPAGPPLALPFVYRGAGLSKRSRKRPPARRAAITPTPIVM